MVVSQVPYVAVPARPKDSSFVLATGCRTSLVRVTACSREAKLANCFTAYILSVGYGNSQNQHQQLRYAGFRHST
eukprot:scaffold541934_cov18-Prasinocladus_malaysianus.AAC.1